MEVSGSISHDISKSLNLLYCKGCRLGAGRRELAYQRTKQPAVEGVESVESVRLAYRIRPRRRPGTVNSHIVKKNRLEKQSEHALRIHKLVHGTEQLFFQA